MLPKKILLSKGNNYLGGIRCKLLGKNIYKVPKYAIIGKSLPKKDVARPGRQQKLQVFSNFGN
jgi:hypothetical protein